MVQNCITYFIVGAVITTALFFCEWVCIMVVEEKLTCKLKK